MNGSVKMLLEAPADRPALKVGRTGLTSLNLFVCLFLNFIQTDIVSHMHSTAYIRICVLERNDGCQNRAFLLFFHSFM